MKGFPPIPEIPSTLEKKQRSLMKKAIFQIHTLATESQFAISVRPFALRMMVKNIRCNFPAKKYTFSYIHYHSPFKICKFLGLGMVSHFCKISFAYNALLSFKVLK